MKIAMYSDVFYPELTGIGDSIVTLSRQLAMAGHHVRFFVPAYSKKNYRIAGKDYQEIQLPDGVSIHRFPSIHVGGSSGQGRLVIPSSAALRAVKEFQPDVIHSQLYFGVGINALIASHKTKIPLVGTNHTAISEYMKSFPGWTAKLMRRYAVWYYNHCQFVTAPSSSVFDEMTSDGFDRPHKILSNPIDTETFHPVSDERKSELRKKFKFGQPAIFYAGRLGAEKNIDVILKAMPDVLSEFPDAKLALAGHGSQREMLEKLAVKIGTSDRVIFLGTLDKASLAEAYQASDIFVITSTSETQSLTLMQGMASGLPVIGARARALPEYINDKNGFLITPGSHEELARYIIEISKDKVQREILGQGSRSTAERYSPASIADEWLKIYTQAIG